MPSCLGLYIENNIIKYAKIAKERDDYKIESYGIKFYDDANKAIKQIVSETFSFKTPVSVNLSNEKYTYANLFKLLSKKDLEKAAQTEFELYCNESGKNKNAIEYRNIMVPNLENKDKLESIYVYSDKSNLVGKLQLLDGLKVTNIIPLAMSIKNLQNINTKKNSIIINIEENTSITTVVNGNIQRVNTIEKGMKQILDNIMLKENSYAKAYEICKNTTIYTSQGRNLQVEENEYMSDIMPVLYDIIEETKSIIKANGIDIDNIYISGLAASINNIDLYFQENFLDKTCEILTPFFVNKANIKLNIKDYIEVNSAIALAMQGLGAGAKEINFKRTSILEKLNTPINLESKNKENKSKDGKTNDLKDKFLNSFTTGWSDSLDQTEKTMLRIMAGILVLIILYVGFTKIISGQINKKTKETEKYIQETQKQVETVVNYTASANQKTRSYEDLIEKINEANDKLTQTYARRNKIPDLLNEIGNIIPKGVQILYIKNPTNKQIQIKAQSAEYDQLGYFISKIKIDGILENVQTSQTEKQNEYIQITITGDLVY